MCVKATISWLGQIESTPEAIISPDLTQRKNRENVNTHKAV